MKKVYIARRIPKEPQSEFILNIRKDMSSEEVSRLYVERTTILENYIYNGPWILRPPLSEDVFSLNNMPKSLTPVAIWEMVKQKIESSDIFIGIVNGKAYGTIAEIGYACNCKNIAVYILPEFGIIDSQLQDLWFMFQMCKTNKHLWCDEDIVMIHHFSDRGIRTVLEYELYISKIVPNFMKD